MASLTDPISKTDVTERETELSETEEIEHRGQRAGQHRVIEAELGATSSPATSASVGRGAADLSSVELMLGTVQPTSVPGSDDRSPTVVLGATDEEYWVRTRHEKNKIEKHTPGHSDGTRRLDAPVQPTY